MINMDEKILGVKAGRLWDIPGFLTVGWPLSKLVGYAGFANEGELVRALEIYSQKMGIEMPDVSPRTGIRHVCRGWEFSSRPYPMYRPLWGQYNWGETFLPVVGVKPKGFPNGLSLLPQGAFEVKSEDGQAWIESGEDRSNRTLFLLSDGILDETLLPDDCMGITLLPETNCQILASSSMTDVLSIVALMEVGQRVLVRKYHRRMGWRIIEYIADIRSDTGVREVEYSEREYDVKLKLGI